MKYPVFLFFLFIGRSLVDPIISNETELPVSSEIAAAKPAQIFNTFFQFYNLQDSIPKTRGGEISVLDFGAKCDGVTDDIMADSTACAYCIAHPVMCGTVTFPVGHSRISRTLKLQNNGRYFTIALKGTLSAKSASDAYLSAIDYTAKSGSAVSVQYGRGITISNLAIFGKYMFPLSVSNYNIGTLSFTQWNDGSVSDSRYLPYAGITIDPDTNKSGTRGGTSDVTIDHCSIKEFMVGVCLSPNGITQNDEMVNFLEDNIEACRVAIAICQDQSKSINIRGLKCWASTHTILDGVNYGKGLGGGSVFCENWNIAGNVNELFNITTTRFPLSCQDIYSESIFRIGNVGPMANFINTQIDFLSGPGMPAADYLLSGWANFEGGMLRYYDNSYTHRLNFSNLNVMFRDMTLNNPPIIASLYGFGINNYPSPKFDNVKYYYSQKRDTLFKLPLIPAFTIDHTGWTASFSGGSGLQTGDYILAAPTSTSGHYSDRSLNSGQCATIQIGRVSSISNGVVHLDDVGLNAYSGNNYDAVFVDRLK
jgi:hypothetical protein